MLHRHFRQLILLALLAAPLFTTTARAQLARKDPPKLTLPAELPYASGYSTLDALPGIRFHAPVAVVTPPGEKDRLFVVEKEGRIIVINNYSTKPVASTFLDVPALCKARGDELAQENEWGLLGLAFHPQYAKNGLFYITYDFLTQDGNRRQGFDRLSRFSVSKANPNAADPNSEVPMITQRDDAPNHDAGDLHFGPDDYLYYSMGDEGNQGDFFDNSRFMDKDFYCSLFRLDVDGRPTSLAPNSHKQDSTKYPSAVHPGTYKIPPDNPSIGVTSFRGNKINPARLRTEIFANGFRNPWRFSIDSLTGQIFVGDVGDGWLEEVDLVKPGGDYGWAFMEGTNNGPRNGQKPPGWTGVPPIYQYTHTNGDNCIIGGVVYRGGRFTELYGSYIFSDFGSRRIYALKENAGKWTCSTLCNDSNMAAFGTDPRNGDVLCVDHGNGQIKRLVRTGLNGTPPPALLSQTGAFSNTAKLTPADGLVPFTPNVSFWSDYAIKTRWFTLPDAASKITYKPDGNWTFPTGTVWVKHFDLEIRRGDPTSLKRRLETRFLVKTATGSYGLTYKWRPDELDADLVPEGGADEEITVRVDGNPQKQIWHYPARSECMVCHTSQAGDALGFNTRQLNGNCLYGSKTLNQLTALSDAGFFTAPVTVTADTPAYVAATDTKKPLDARVRSYLAVNCVQCHQPGGSAQGLWDARPGTVMSAANIVRGKLINPGADPLNRFAAPNDPAHSMVLKRIKADGAPRMPPLASSEIDPGAVKLLTEWIKQLPLQGP